MINKLLQWFEQIESKSVNTTHSVELATAVLFYEIARADENVDEIELNAKRQLLQQHFSLDSLEIENLVELAKETSIQASDFSQFTRIIHQHCSAQEKMNIVESLWALALADGVIDAHEEYLIRKVSDLLYVDHKHFIQAKLSAQSSIHKT